MSLGKGLDFSHELTMQSFSLHFQAVLRLLLGNFVCKCTELVDGGEMYESFSLDIQSAGRPVRRGFRALGYYYGLRTRGTVITGGALSSSAARHTEF